MALSISKKWLAVAERSEKAPIVSIYRVDVEKKDDGESRKSDAKVLKKRKTICSLEINKQKEFVSMAFAPRNEKLLVTLTCEHEHV